MDKNWSDMNKEMQALLSRKETFVDGVNKLIELRKSLFEQITQIVTTFPSEAFYQMPFAGVDGYHAKTLAYSIWHIFRIEDIVAHEMIAEDQQIRLLRPFWRRFILRSLRQGTSFPGMVSRHSQNNWTSRHCTGTRRKS